MTTIYEEPQVLPKSRNNLGVKEYYGFVKYHTNFNKSLTFYVVSVSLGYSGRNFLETTI